MRPRGQSPSCSTAREALAQLYIVSTNRPQVVNRARRLPPGGAVVGVADHAIGGEEIPRVRARMNSAGRLADTVELRDKLLGLARVWMEAVLTEEQAEAGRPSPSRALIVL